MVENSSKFVFKSFISCQNIDFALGKFYPRTQLEKLVGKDKDTQKSAADMPTYQQTFLHENHVVMKFEIGRVKRVILVKSLRISVDLTSLADRILSQVVFLPLAGFATMLIISDLIPSHGLSVLSSPSRSI